MNNEIKMTRMLEQYKAAKFAHMHAPRGSHQETKNGARMETLFAKADAISPEFAQAFISSAANAKTGA
jgi:hypothetical protein